MQVNFVSLVAGARGTGKTDLLKDLVMASPLPKKLIVDTFDSPPWRNMKTHDKPDWENVPVQIMDQDNIQFWKTGLYRSFSSDPEGLFSEIDQYCKNTFIVFEDASKYVGSKLTSDMRRFVYDSKQKNLNLVFVFHSLAAIPPELVRAADYLTLFKTNEGKPSKDKYPFPDIPIAMDIVKESKNRFHHITIRLN